MNTRARRLAEEQAALARLEQACERRQNAFISLDGNWLPHGCGTAVASPLYETAVAEAEVREAQAELTRITLR